MFVLFLLVLLIIIIALFFAIFKLIKWISKQTIRIKWAMSILTFLMLAFIIKKVFFTNMEFIQSNVYSNLYIVKNPVKNKVQLKDAILYKIKNHLKTEHKQPKKLSYSNETDCIFFYEAGGMTFGFLGEAGTTYFIYHEEDLGGFVSEELGMYAKYRLAEFYYEPCDKDSTKICGELNFFSEGSLIQTDSLKIQINEI